MSNTTSKLLGVVQGKANSSLADALGRIIRATYISNVTWDSTTHTLSFYSGNILKYSCVVDLGGGGDFNLYVFTPVEKGVELAAVEYRIRYINGDSGDYVKEYGRFSLVGSDAFKLSSWSFTPYIATESSSITDIALNWTFRNYYTPRIPNELCLHDPNSANGDYYIIRGYYRSAQNPIDPVSFTTPANIIVASFINFYSFYVIHNPNSQSDYKKVTCSFSLANNGDYTDFSDWTPTLVDQNYFSAVCLHDPNSDNYKFIKGYFPVASFVDFSWSGLPFVVNNISFTGSTFMDAERQYINLVDSTTNNVLQVVGDFTLNSGATGDSYSDWSFAPKLSISNSYSYGYAEYNNVHTHRIVKEKSHIEIYSLTITQSSSYTDGESYDQYAFPLSANGNRGILVDSSRSEGKVLRWIYRYITLNNNGDPESYDDYSFSTLVPPTSQWAGEYWGLQCKGRVGTEKTIYRVSGAIEGVNSSEYDEWVFNPTHASGLEGTPALSGTIPGYDPAGYDPETGDPIYDTVSIPYKIDAVYNLKTDKSGKSVYDYEAVVKSGAPLRFYLPDGKSYKEAYGHIEEDFMTGHTVFVPESGGKVTWKLYGEDGKSYKTIKGTVLDVGVYLENVLRELRLQPSTKYTDKAEWKIYDANSDSYKTLECLSRGTIQSPVNYGKDYGDFSISSSTNGFWVINDGTSDVYQDEKWIYGAMTGNSTISFTISTSSTAHKWIIHYPGYKNTKGSNSGIKTVYGKFVLKSGGTAGTYADYNFTLSTSSTDGSCYSKEGSSMGFYYNNITENRCTFTNNSSGTSDYAKYTKGTAIYPGYRNNHNTSNLNGNYVESASLTSTPSVTTATKVIRKGKQTMSLTGSNWTISSASGYSNWILNDDYPTGYIEEDGIRIYGGFVRAGI